MFVQTLAPPIIVFLIALFAHEMGAYTHLRSYPFNKNVATHMRSNFQQVDGPSSYQWNVPPESSIRVCRVLDCDTSGVHVHELTMEHRRSVFLHECACTHTLKNGNCAHTCTIMRVLTVCGRSMAARASNIIITMPCFCTVRSHQTPL